MALRPCPEGHNHTQWNKAKDKRKTVIVYPVKYQIIALICFNHLKKTGGYLRPGSYLIMYEF